MERNEQKEQSQEEEESSIRRRRKSRRREKRFKTYSVPALDKTLVGSRILLHWNIGWVCGRINRHYIVILYRGGKKMELSEGGDKVTTY